MDQSVDNQAAATVELVSGQVFAVGQDGARELAVGSPVYVNDVLTPGGAGAVELRAVDGGQLARLGPGQSGQMDGEFFTRHGVPAAGEDALATRLQFDAVVDSGFGPVDPADLLSTLFLNLESGLLSEAVPVMAAGEGLPDTDAPLAAWLAAGSDLLAMAERLGPDGGDAGRGQDALARIQGLIEQGGDLGDRDPAELAAGFEPAITAFTQAQAALLATLPSQESAGDMLQTQDYHGAVADPGPGISDQPLHAGDLLSDVTEANLDAVLSFETDQDGERISVAGQDGVVTVETRSVFDIAVGGDGHGPTLDVPMHHDFHWDS